MKYFLAASLVASITASAAGPVPFDRLLKADTEPANWFMYSGNYRAHRSSALDQIDTSNVHGLRLKWIYQMKTTHHVEVTPLVVDGIMYVTRPPSDVIALDAQTGRKFWELLPRATRRSQLLRSGKSRSRDSQ